MDQMSGQTGFPVCTGGRGARPASGAGVTGSDLTSQAPGTVGKEGPLRDNSAPKEDGKADGTWTKRCQSQPGSQGALGPSAPGFARLHPPRGQQRPPLEPANQRASHDLAGRLLTALGHVSKKPSLVISCAWKSYPNT